MIITTTKYQRLCTCLHPVTRHNPSRLSAILFIVTASIFSTHNSHANDKPVTNANMVISSSSADTHAATQVLDQLNQYSSSADWDKYFALYRQDGIFIGTDAKERWEMAEFERYSRPTKGWRYDLTSRHLVQHGDVILFDELLNSPIYGVSRGTGTLIKTNGEWKIAQYHLSFPIPNDIAKKITAEIKNAQ